MSHARASQLHAWDQEVCERREMRLHTEPQGEEEKVSMQLGNTEQFVPGLPSEIARGAGEKEI